MTNAGESEWTKIEDRESSHLNLAGTTLTKTSVRRSDDRPTRAETARWESGDGISAFLYYSYIVSGYVYVKQSQQNLEEIIRDWFGGAAVVLGYGGQLIPELPLLEYQTFAHRKTPCALFRQFWGGDRGVDIVRIGAQQVPVINAGVLGDNQLIGYTCNIHKQDYSREDVQAFTINKPNSALLADSGTAMRMRCPEPGASSIFSPRIFSI